MHNNNQLQRDRQQGRWLSGKAYPLGPRNPWYRYTLFALVVLLSAVILLFALSSRFVFHHYEAKSAPELADARVHPGLSSEIESLKGQLAAIITGSIESKIRLLESSIRNGRISAADLGTIQDLKNDLNILKSYSGPALSSIHRESMPSSSSIRRSAEERQLLQEVSHLKNLFYASIVAYGLLVLAMGGVWLQNLHHFRQLQKTMRQPALLEKRNPR